MDLEKLPLLYELNMSNTRITGPLPVGLFMPPMAPATQSTPSSMTTSSFLTLDVSGVPDADTPLCAPYNLTLSDSPSRTKLIKNGEDFDVPVCEQYVEWTVTLSEDPACLMAEVCSSETQKPYMMIDEADAPMSSDSGEYLTLRSRAESASEAGKSVAELSCEASCPDTADSDTVQKSTLAAVTVREIMNPAAPNGLLAARSHSTPERNATESTAEATAAPPALVPADSRRKLSGVSDIAAMLGNRRLLLPALVDLPPAEYRTHMGSLSVLEKQHRHLMQQPNADATDAPTVKFVTVGIAPSEEAGTALLKSLFPDVLTPADLSTANIDWQGGEAAVATAVAATPTVQDPATATAGAGGVSTTGEAGDSSITAANVPQEKSDEKKSLPVILMITIFTLVALLAIVLALLGFWRWRTSLSVRSLSDGKSSSYLSAGVPMMREEGSIASDYSRITPASEEYTVTHLGSVSMSVNGVRDLNKESSAQTLPLGSKSGAGNNSRRPLWMQLDTSGSVLLHSRKEHSKSHQNCDSGSASASDAITRKMVPGRSKYMAEFPQGSPVKSLLKNQDGCDANEKLPPVSGSGYCESELEPQRVRIFSA